MSARPVVLAQGDVRWRGLQLGNGALRVGGHGCLLVALTQAVRELKVQPDALPPHVQEACRRARAFGPASSNLTLPTAAEAVGLSSPLRARVDSEDASVLARALEQALETGGLAILQVDHDRDRAGGDMPPDHFVLATGFRTSGIGGRLELAVLDPATGREELLLWPTLTGNVRWSALDVRTYRVLSVRPVHRAPPAPAAA